MRFYTAGQGTPKSTSTSGGTLDSGGTVRVDVLRIHAHAHVRVHTT
jgi:hypothetical protein